VNLITLDIEGAELVVLRQLLERFCIPQIAIEFDCLLNPSLKSRKIYQVYDGLLRANGYALVSYERPSNFLYVLENMTSQNAQ
jgi:hypothetical protein